MVVSIKNISFVGPPIRKSIKNQTIANIIRQRRKRQILLSWAIKFSAGDIFAVTFWKHNYIYRFEGICIRKTKKGLLDPDVSLTLRNVLLGVGIECTVSYYYNRVYQLHIQDYKRKRFVYRRAKLYYLRQKLNRASRVK